MTDRDIIERVAKLLNRKVYGPYINGGKASYKPVYAVALTGGHAVGMLMTLYSNMGERRQAKIRELITLWKAAAPGYAYHAWRMSIEKDTGAVLGGSSGPGPCPGPAPEPALGMA